MVPPSFILGVKINAGDYVDCDTDTQNGRIEENQIGLKESGMEDAALDHIRTLANWGGVDFIEISGGDYENPSE